MIIFLDENDVEYGALSTIKATNAVNGERSLTGTIVSGDYVLSNIERGWRLRFDDEYYVVTYAKPIDEGRDVQVTFDAVHQFFWDFDKSSVYDQLTDGSHTFVAYLDFIFKNSGYSYTVDSALNVYAFEKQSFGLKKRLTLFNDVITSTGVEFQVNGKVVRILEKVGTDLSTVVRKNFNMNELTIEKNIGDFVTYQKGYGAYFDEEDHSKGRLEVEYTSTLASVYGKLEAEPLVDERYTQSSSLLSALKESVDNSYTISVSLDMEDLTRAGYKYTQPIAGDYIMAINETLDFQEKIRIVSFTSEYDVRGILVKHEVTCNDIGTAKKLTASYNTTKRQASTASINATKAYSIANRALVSADGKNTNYYGNSFPQDTPKGTLKTGDLLFLAVGDTVKQYYWNGSDWIINPVVSDVEAFKEQIAEELKEVPDREEFETTIAEKLATSKAELKTQIDTAKTQAESNAKAYADEINQATAKVSEQANAAANSLKSDLAKVKADLTTTTTTANSAKTSASEAKQQLTTVANDLSTAKQDLQNAVSAVDTKAMNLQSDLTEAKQDLTSQASQLQAQANAQTELTKRVSTVEKTANGTKTTVSELSKTVDSNTKNISSVTARTKTVEDDLLNTKTMLSQVKTTANSASQKAATLETGLNGLSARFSSLKIGGRNLLAKTNQGKTNWSWPMATGGGDVTIESVDIDGVSAVKMTKGNGTTSGGWNMITYSGLLRNLIESNTQYTLSFDVKPNVNAYFIATLMQSDAQNRLTNSVGMGTALADVWTRISCVLTSVATLPESVVSQVVYLQGMPTANGNTVMFKNIKLEKGNIATDYSPNEADLELKVADYKQTADQNYASLQSTVQALDGTVTANKTTADQTAQGFSTRIESLETYKGGETTRASQYFESAKTETARQLTAERTAIAKDYVAKSTYTSDVTGIRNDLTATTTTANTTKTNLANYQASNDKAVANLQSNLQTANGNISSLKTKVEAVPGQITSAVSAVEGKIPTEIGGRNLYALSKEIGRLGAKGGVTNLALDVANGTLSFDVNGAHPYFGECVWGGIDYLQTYGQLIPVKENSAIAVSFTSADFNENYVSFVTNGKGAKGPKLFRTQRITLDASELDGIEYIVVRGGINNSNDSLTGETVTTKIKVEYSNVYSDWTAAPEDTASQISNLSSQIKQTKDGMTLLATKTELNTAKSDLQSGIATATNKANAAQSTADSNAKTISTHTTQISVLNTGLSAKVSQTDFNTLSGRVTTAENNITAKANELSSKISSLDADFEAKNTELKQTTDAISASVSALDSSTVKTASLTINTDGIVMKAGKSTTDVANAIGAYFAVNQNAISLFSDKINVKANMIVDGAITSTKIASKSINTAHLNGKIITADVISSNAITADAIKTGAVTTDKMTANSINGDRITAGTLDAAKIKAGSITASQIASGTITSSQIKAGGISTANIAAGAITTDKIISGAIDGDKIAANAITADKIATNALTADLIQGGILKSRTNSIKWDLDHSNLTFSEKGKIVFTNTDNTISYTKKQTTGLLKFNDADYNAPEVTLGVNRSGAFATNDGTFTGVRVRGYKYSNGAFVDEVYNIGDKIILTGGYNENNGFLFQTAGDNLGFFPRANRRYALGSPDRRFTTLYLDDVNIRISSTKTYSLREVIGTLAGLAGVRL